MEKKTIAVTGGNRGLGFELIKLLLEKTDLNIVLVARSQTKADKAIKELQSEFPEQGGRLRGAALDLEDSETFESFFSQISSGVDILYNNAGFSMINKEHETEEGRERAIKVNLLGTIKLTEEVIKRRLINKRGRIVNVSSNSGRIIRIEGYQPEIHQRIRTGLAEMKMEELDEWIRQLLEDVKSEQGRAKYPRVYAVTKVFLNVYTFIRSRYEDLLQDLEVEMYAVDPGFCLTGMTLPYLKIGVTPPLTAEEGGRHLFAMVERPFGLDLEKQGGFFRHGVFSTFLE